MSNIILNQKALAIVNKVRSVKQTKAFVGITGRLLGAAHTAKRTLFILRDFLRRINNDWSIYISSYRYSKNWC